MHLINQFFHLLRCALWEKNAEVTLFADVSDADWEQLYQMAYRQAVIGLIYDALITLPDACQPPRNLKLKWFMMVQKIEQSNLMLNQSLAEASTHLHQANINHILMKGQGVASFYPNPLRRQTGDIDLFFPSPADYSKALEWIRMQSIQESEVIKHISFHWNDAHLEFHDHLDLLHYPIANRRMQHYFAEKLKTDGYETITINGKLVRMLPPELNMIFVMLHALNHFLPVGVGLRQLCDWARYVHTHRNQADKEALTKLFERTGLLRLANAFASIQINYLGLDPALIPFEYVPEPLGDVLLQDILEGGNFGFHRQGFNRPNGKWRGKFYTARKMVERSIRFFPFSPTETIWYPIHYTLGTIRLVLQGRM